MKDINKPHIYDALVLDRALEKKIQEKDLVSNSEVFDIVEEVVNRVKWPKKTQANSHKKSGFVKISRNSGNYEFRNPFQLSKGGF